MFARLNAVIAAVALLSSGALAQGVNRIRRGAGAR